MRLWWPHTLLRMDFATSRRAFIASPAEIVKPGIQIVFRILAWNRWLPTFLCLLDQLHTPRG